MLKFKDNTKLYFTSDPHFYHKNIIDYCTRPFKLDHCGQILDEHMWVHEMHKSLITNWNHKISENDIVFILGDFAHTGDVEKIKLLLVALNGIKYLILGNHDYQNKFNRKKVRDLFAGTYDILDIKIHDDEIEDGYQWINLCHYPIESWSKRQKGSWHLHGHIHSGPKSTSSDRNIQFFPNRYDVGVDNNMYTPLSYQEVKTIITKQNLNGV